MQAELLFSLIFNLDHRIFRGSRLSSTGDKNQPTCEYKMATDGVGLSVAHVRDKTLFQSRIYESKKNIRSSILPYVNNPMPILFEGDNIEKLSASYSLHLYIYSVNYN